ncbi:putative quinol monooxygenase [Vibrio marisflavi]|nr:hypothetical protein [Vibrio marisflavi]
MGDLYEEWSDKASLENHHQQEHTQQVASKFESWLSEETQVSIMNKLEA